MAAYIALFIALVSLILMIVILIRFKKLFSTDAIIEKTKSQMNRVIMDVNNNANRDMELINESSRRLRALLNEADKKMENFREATQLLRNTMAEAEKFTSNKKTKEVFIDPDAAYRVTDKGPAKQGTLFDEPEVKPILKDETVVTQEGAAYKEVPLFKAKVYDEKPGTGIRTGAVTAAPVKSNRSLKEKVEKLFHQGMQVDDIAEELSCPVSEVQFIIDML